METTRHWRLLSKGYKKLPSSNLASSQHEKNIFRRFVKVAPLKIIATKAIRNLKTRLRRQKENSRKVKESHLEDDDDDEYEQITVDDKIQNQHKDQNQRLNRQQHSTSMKIYVKIASNKKTIVVEARGYHIVHEIKSKILVAEGVKQDQYSLFHGGKSLEDYRTLVSLGIKTESTLHLIFHPRTLLPIIVRTPTGKLLSFEVQVLYTIRNVKTIVESFVGCPVDECKIFYAGNELEDCKSLAFYEIEENSTLELQPSWIQIFVKTWSSKTITLHVMRSNSIREVKEKLFCKVGMPICRQNIVFCGRILDENRSLLCYNVEKHSTLHMLLKH
ncbi:polyubiquitin-like [Humulus lupulus]|uniref:polyubiquitin-like n=1 Tax=Humulus lupulus TaxID=3486 RepID=UPI002B415110|nr:polyubiquitin-like [Humulus lupulus]